MKPQCRDILAVLADHKPHGAIEFLRGTHGFHVNAVSQRITDLRALGYVIESTGRGGHDLATYCLISAPIASVEEASGQLAAVM